MDTEYRVLSKRNLLLFFSFFALYAGYLLGNRLLVCFGFALLFLYVFTFHTAHNFFRDFTARRIHYDRTFENENLRVRIQLSAQTSLPLYMVEVADIFPAGDLYNIRALIPDRIDKNSLVELEYQEVCTRKRGVYVLGPLKLVCSDPLGIHRVSRELDVLTNLLVYPQAPDLEYFQVLGDGTLSQVGMETLLKPGHSEEFTGLREYQEGDNPRRIHWPTSARHERLFVKEFREDVITEVSLFLDMHRLALSGVGDVTSVEYIIKAAAALARVAIEKSHLVQVFSLSSSPAHIPPGGGYHHLITILDHFTYLRPQGEDRLEADLASYVPLLKPGSTAVLIACATAINPETLVPLLRHILDRRIRISVILVDDRSFLKVFQDQDYVRRHAPPLAGLREILSREGCGLFLLAKGDDVARKLQEQVR